MFFFFTGSFTGTEVYRDYCSINRDPFSPFRIIKSLPDKYPVTCRKLMAGSRILIVEDDDVLTRIITWRLTNLGYVVCGRASSSEEAVEIIVKERPDLVLMDINIKGDLDGIETTSLVKKGFGLPVIYLTSHSDGPTLERARATRPNGFVLKPFGDTDLRVAIELALNRS
jgi:two-component system, response regulator PdtaR